MAKRIICAILIATLVASLCCVASACIGHGGLYYDIDSNHISASILKCSCAPVNNYLYVSTKAQYMDANGDYHWTNWKEVYGTDTNYKLSTTYANNLYCGYCHYRWECYEGNSGFQLQEHFYSN